MSSLARPYYEIVRMGFLDFQVANPWKVRATTAWPRAILQCLFFVLLGRFVVGGFNYVFIGSMALAITLPTSVGLCSVPMTDKSMGTFFHLRLGRSPAAAVIAARAIPWLVEALTMFVFATVGVGLILDHVGLAARLLALLPLFTLMAITNAAAGLAIASFAVDWNADTMAGNALIYLIIAAGGIIVPPGRLTWLGLIGRWLPIRNGLLAVRGIIAHRPWGRDLLAEIGVCALWTTLAVAGYGYKQARARRTGASALD